MFPLLVRVTICAALVVPTCWPAKVRLPGASETTGPELVPLRSMTWEDPAAMGTNVKENAQLLAAGTLLPQVFVSAKLEPAVVDEISSGELPIFRSRAVCAGLVEPTD